MLRRRGYVSSLTVGGTLTANAITSGNGELRAGNDIVLAGQFSKLVGGYNPNPVTALGGLTATKLFAVGTALNVEKAYFTSAGKLGFTDASDTTGTPGNATANTPIGKSAVAAAASAVTITNNQVVAGSRVIVTKLDNDATATDFKVAEAVGSFTVTFNAAATADLKFNWLVLQTG